MDTHKPLVSVAVISYNHGSYIRKCLDSILMQKTNFSFEVVIGDDCSTDETVSIIREFEQKFPNIIKPIYQSKNVGGAANAYGSCYPKLSGKYVAICEGDDYWTDENKLQKQVDFLEQHPDYVLTFHRVNSVDKDDNILENTESTDTILYTWRDVIHLSIPTLSAVFRKCFDTIPKEMYQVRSGDTFLFGMLSRYGHAADLGFIGASYRKHVGGVYSHKAVVEQFKQTIETRKIMKRCDYFTSEQKAELSKEIRKRKRLYFKYFFKRSEIANCFKIVLT